MTQSRGPGVGVIVFLSCMFGLLAGVGGAALYARLRPGSQSGSPTVVTTSSAIAPARSSSTVTVSTDQDAIVSAAAVAGPAAVKVETIHQRPLTIFDLFSGNLPDTERGIGSGFIFAYEDKRYVLTNTHVVAGQRRRLASEVDVVLPDGRTLKGKVAGWNTPKDIAIIGLVNPPVDVPAVELGDSDALRVGEWVLAIGNPFDFEHTVTVGVVSAKRPFPMGNGRTRELIQTDAAINRGNSGGPLVNLAGQVVGINTMIYSGTGYSIGIGFAIPINQAKDLLYYLLHRGPYIGVQMRPNSPGLAKYADLPTDRGVVVAEAFVGTPAAKAGVRRGDVVTQVDGQVVNTPEEMQRAIRKHPIGGITVLTVVRHSATTQLSVKTGHAPDSAYDR